MKLLKIKSLLSIFALCAVLVFSGCSSPSIPEYKSFKIGKIKRVDKKWQISGNALFMNNNSFGGNVKTCDIDVFMNDVLATHVNQSIKVNIDANSEFKIPVTFSVDTKQLRKEHKGFLKGALKSLFKEKIDLRYDGNFVVDFMGTAVKVPFEYEEKVGFGVNYE